MPKTGPTATKWMGRLRDYARGKFRFGKGEKPSSGSRWYKEVLAIEACPLLKNLRVAAGQRTLESRPLQCSCGYHVSW